MIKKFLLLFSKRSTSFLPYALAALTVARLAVAAAMPLSPDEAYYWVWSRDLAPGYLDHPPMVAVWIWAGTALLGDGALGVRLLGPLSAALGSLLLAQAGEDLLPGRRAGVLAAALLNATLLFGVGAVTMTPDTPVLLFWTAALWALARLVATGRARWWLVAGAMIGLAATSKYTGLLLGIGVLAWVLWVPAMRLWLRRPAPWLGGLFAVLVFAPVLAWNALHGWASFAKQGGRAGVFDLARAPQFLGELIGGQLGLATPVIAVLCAAGMVLAVRRLRDRDPAWSLLAALSALPALLFLEHALGDRVQANWPAVIYPAAAIAAAGLAPGWRRAALPGIALGLALTAFAWTQATIAPLALPMRLDPTLLRLGGWERLAADIETERAKTGAIFVVSDNYGHAALLARLLPPTTPVYAMESRWRYFTLPPAPIAGRVGLLVRSTRRDEASPEGWADISLATTIDRARHGMTAEGFRLYRVTGGAENSTSGDPVVVLPRPR